ncbi:MAG: hypothetical protein [Caudoviricetes sp.]|nr:MAG: hypothetical protein [Caudoviricetes sp.]
MSVKYQFTTTITCDCWNCCERSTTTITTDQIDLFRTCNNELIGEATLPGNWAMIKGELYCPKHWYRDTDGSRKPRIGS